MGNGTEYQHALLEDAHPTGIFKALTRTPILLHLILSGQNLCPTLC